MRRLVVAFSIAALASAPMLVPGSAAAGCGNVTQIGIFYIDDRSAQGDSTNAWLYMESNGVAGLQAGGRSVTGLYHDTECVESASPDTLIF